jgi:branched-chain amino acid transport system substrate-binding protein
MKKLLIAAALTALFGSANAQQTVKIGMPLTLSGQFADAANQMLAGARTYMKMHGDTVAGKKIELITKDVGGPAPDVAKRLSQELVVRDNVDILAGYVLTPNAMAGGDVSAEAKKFMIRTSVTLPQVMETFGTWAATKGGIKQSYTMVTDYGPGHDSENAFHSAFKAAGGTIVGSVRFPVANPDFSAFVQRAKDIAPQSIFIFIPGGAQPAALGKAFAERGIDLNKTRVLGSGETTAEAALKGMGDNALGIITAWHYDYMSNNPLNVKFVKEYQGVANGRNPDFFSIGGYDGMHAIYEALKKTGGKTDADALVNAAKGLRWESPRGPMMIDPETRDVVQNVYIRRVQKVGNDLVNVPFDTISMVKDPAGERRKQGAAKK